MTGISLSTGVDVVVREDQPTESYPDQAYPWLSGRSGKRRRILLKFSSLPEQVRGRTILSATLSARTRVGGSHQVTIQALTSAFSATAARWGQDGGPAATTTGQAQATVAAASGNRWTMDVAALAQRVANGTAYYGWRLSTTLNGDRSYYGFETGDSWQLTIVVSDDSDAPVSLEPDGGAVGIAKPTLTWTADDPDPDETEAVGAQVAYQVQIDRPATGADPDWTTPDYASGEVASTESQHAMSAYAFSLTSGALTYWRVRIKDAAARWSEWSDPAVMTYQPLPTVTITSPSGGQIFDPSPVVQASLSGSAVETYRVLVFDATDARIIRYDSMRLATDATAITHTIPSTYNGTRVFDDSAGSYRIEVRFEDRTDRVASPGDNAYVTASTTVAYAASGDPAPTSLSVTQPGAFPEARLRFTRGSAADVWIFERSVSGGSWKTIADIEADETMSEDGNVVPDGSGAWTWIDQTAPAGVEVRYRVRAVTNGQQTAPSPVATIRLACKGVWLVRYQAGGAEHNERLCLAGPTDGLEQSESSADYMGIAAQRGFSLVYAQRGIAGPFDGVLEVWPDQPIDAALAVARRIRKARTQYVRLVYGETNVPVQLSGMSITSGEEYRPNTRAHRVRFDAEQVGEFETTR